MTINTTGYDELLTIHERKTQIEAIKDWLWIKEDTGVWNGVKHDWPDHEAKIRQWVKKFDCVVQAGGNLGVYPYLLTEMFSRIYTFEPDPLNFFCLVNNTQCDNIVKIQAALGAEHVMVSVNRNLDWNVGMHTVKFDQEGLIPQLMVDDLNLKECDLIWFDIEGYEHQALMGARQTIIKHKPIVMIERGDSICSNFLSEFGYREVDKSLSDTIYST